jgi:hypothetical protein
VRRLNPRNEGVRDSDETIPFSESMSDAVAPYLPKISTNDADHGLAQRAAMLTNPTHHSG